MAVMDEEQINNYAEKTSLCRIISDTFPFCKTDEQRMRIDHAKSLAELEKIGMEYVKQNPILAYELFCKENIDYEEGRNKALDVLIESNPELPREEIVSRFSYALTVLQQILEESLSMEDNKRLLKLKCNAAEIGCMRIAKTARILSYRRNMPHKLPGKLEKTLN